jgi:hypothetical protein
MIHTQPQEKSSFYKLISRMQFKLRVCLCVVFVCLRVCLVWCVYCVQVVWCLCVSVRVCVCMCVWRGAPWSTHVHPFAHTLFVSMPGKDGRALKPTGQMPEQSRQVNLVSHGS